MYPIIPDHLENEIALRTEKIHSQLERHELDAVLITSNANIFYASARYFRGYILVTRESAPIYFVVKPSQLEGANTVYIRKPEQIPDEMAKLGIPIPAAIGLEYDAMTYTEIERLKKVFAASEIRNGSGVLRNARMVKTEYEIEQMKEDARHQMAVYERIPKLWVEGMSDVELQIAIEHDLRLEGALGYTRTFGAQMEINCGSLLVGDNADVPSPYDFSMGGEGMSPALPVGASGEIIRTGMTVMVDMSGAFNGYQSDLTRTWRVGDVPEIAMKSHECSRRILREMEAMARPGVMTCDLYNRAMEIAGEEGLADYFMGHCQQVAFIGHGVGIDLNESPVLTPRGKEKLEAGMTIAIEPKFVIPGVGATGVENTYVVLENRLENITNFPEELANLE